LTSILILFFQLQLGLPIGIFLSDLPTKILHTFLITFIRSTCSAHLILLGFITLMLKNADYDADYYVKFVGNVLQILIIFKSSRPKPNFLQVAYITNSSNPVTFTPKWLIYSKFRHISYIY
jgi:hypothetical protein